MNVKKSTSDDEWLEKKKLRVAIHYRVISVVKPILSSPFSMNLHAVIHTSKTEVSGKQLVYGNLHATNKGTTFRMR